MLDQINHNNITNKELYRSLKKQLNFIAKKIKIHKNNTYKYKYINIKIYIYIKIKI